MTPLEQARAIAADRYPETLTDTQGRTHRCIPREAILCGHWDSGAAVRDALAGLEKEAALCRS